MLYIIARDTFAGETYDTGIRVVKDARIAGDVITMLYRSSTSTEFYALEADEAKELAIRKATTIV